MKNIFKRMQLQCPVCQHKFIAVRFGSAPFIKTGNNKECEICLKCHQEFLKYKEELLTEERLKHIAVVKKRRLELK